MLAPFQRVLHAAARLVLNLWPRDHVSVALRELHWLPVAQRIDYKLRLLIHKSSRGQAPEYISNMLKAAADDPSLTTLRVAANRNYVVPRTNRRLGETAFSIAAAKAWNTTKWPQDSYLFNGRLQTSSKDLPFQKSLQLTSTLLLVIYLSMIFIIIIITIVITIVMFIYVVTILCYAPPVFTCIVGVAIQMTV